MDINATEIEKRPGAFYKDDKLIRYECQDCKERDPVIFMVKKDLWAQIGLKGFICPECFERRLGRLLVLEDFETKNFANQGIFYGYKFAKRIRGGL